jgi:hypothetical protein
MAADTVSTQTLVDDNVKTVMKFTNLGGGDGESAVKKVDVSELVGAPSKVKIEEVWYSVTGMVATLLWDADTDVRILDLAGDSYHDFRSFGGLKNNGGAGVTGDILLTTTGHSAGDSYWIILGMRKY